MTTIYTTGSVPIIDKILSRRYLPTGLVEVRKQIVGLDDSIIEQINGEPEGIQVSYSEGLVVCDYSIYEIGATPPEIISSEMISVPKTFVTNTGVSVNVVIGTEEWVSETKTIYLLSETSYPVIPSAPALTATLIGPSYGNTTSFQSYPSDVTRQKIGGIFFSSVTFRNKAITS